MTVHYFLPRVDLDVTVKKTVTCDPNNQIFTVLSATHDPAYSASSPATDKDAVQQIDIGRLDGFFSDADLGLSFTEDGRLAGLNVATTGEAGEIVKSAIALAAPIANGLRIAMAQAEGPNRYQEMAEACAKIAMWGKDKTLTLTYSAAIPFASPNGSSGEMVADPSSATYDQELRGQIGNVCWTAGRSATRIPMGLDTANAPSGSVALVLRQPAIARVEIDNWDQPTCGKPLQYQTDLPPPNKTVVWSGDVEVPQHGRLYDVLIPKAAAFGKQSFTLTLSDAGTVTELKYGKTNGVAQAMGSAKSLEDATTESAAERAQRASDEEKAIAAQERLAACRADHSKCGS